MEGWISLHRKIINHWIWKDSVKLKWWMIMLFEVNHTDNKFNLGYEIFEIKKGQSCNSLRTWAKLFDSNTKTVHKFFSLLQKDNMISIKIIGKGKQSTTLINIENYMQYQDEGKHKRLHKSDARETQGKRDRDTNNKGNNDNNELLGRIEIFKTDVLEFKEKYGQEMIEAFFRYWSEPTPDGKKMKKELKDTWSTAGRLATWKSNNNKQQKPGLIYAGNKE